MLRQRRRFLLHKPTSVSTPLLSNNNNNNNNKESFLSFFLSNLNTSFNAKTNQDLLEEFRIVIHEQHIKQQTWLAEAIFDYIQVHKPHKSIVTIDTYIENPDFIAVPNLFCSPKEKRKYLFDSDDNELKRFGRALEEWLAIYNQEFGKR